MKNNKTASRKGFDLRMLLAQDAGSTRLAVILLIAVVTLSLLKPTIFLTRDYIVNMLYLFPEFGILALGMMLCMISGGIDLSVVATANFSGIVASLFLINTIPDGTSIGFASLMLVCAVLLSMLVGLVCGALSAFLIAKLGIPPILATLGASDLIMGLALAFTKGSSVSNLPAILSKVGTHIIGGFLPVTLLIFIACAVGVAFLLNKRTVGFKLYLMGTNATAAKFAGIKNSRVIFTAYMTSGLLAGISGLMMCARFSTARADFGSSYTMQAILICVLGGVNSNGGFGTVRGVALSILILQVLSSGFNMFPGISNFYRDLIWGSVLILVMIYNFLSNRSKMKKERLALTKPQSKQRSGQSDG